MMNIFIIGLLLTTTSLQGTSGANVLAIFAVPSPSHHLWNSVLLKALASRGHTVTVLSPDSERYRAENLTHIRLEGVYEHRSKTRNYLNMKKDTFVTLHTMFEWGTTMCKYGMETDGVKTLMAMNATFDLIIIEMFYECYFGFIPKFGSPPVVALTALASPPMAGWITGSPETPSYIPNYMGTFSDRMSFGERLVNALLNAFVAVYRHHVYLPQIDEIARRRLGADLPPVSQIEANVSLVMVNSHFSMDYSRPLLPAMVPVGGLHIQPAKPLPDELQKFLDDATDGAVYFSLGSLVLSSQMSSDRVAAFVGAFAQLPRQRVLWKWDGETPIAGLSGNVRLARWLPQNDVLAHRNVRLFITHGGLLSTQEAVFHGVPVVGVPFFTDQHTNVQKAVDHGAGERLEYESLTQKVVLTTLRKVLESPSYQANMQRLSAQFRDQPQTALERAVFWTEYVIRHRGAPHLRSAAADLAWYRYWLLDVLAVLVLGTMALFGSFWFAVRACWRVACRGRVEKWKQS